MRIFPSGVARAVPEHCPVTRLYIESSLVTVLSAWKVVSDIPFPRSRVSAAVVTRTSYPVQLSATAVPQIKRPAATTIPPCSSLAVLIWILPARGDGLPLLVSTMAAAPDCHGVQGRSSPSQFRLTGRNIQVAWQNRDAGGIKSSWHSDSTPE